jgi:hypothetical protein
VWYNRFEDISGGAACSQLIREGWKVISTSARFGTVIKFKKGSGWRFVFPCQPDKVMEMQEALQYVKDNWYCHPLDAEWKKEKILIPLARLIG